MAISKVILNGATQMDVTGDTVNAENLLASETATRNDGVQITGTVDLDDYVAKSGDTMTGELYAPHLSAQANDSVNYPRLWIRDANGNACISFLQTAAGNGRLRVRETTSPTTSSTNYEDYRLPAPTASNGSETYEIVTTKPGEGFVYKANDTFTTITTASYRPIWAGVIANDAKTIYISVIVDQSLSGISSIAVSTFTGWIYGIGGAIESSTTSTNWVSNYTVTANKSADHVVRVAIKKKDSTVFSGATESTPVSASINTVLTFS